MISTESDEVCIGETGICTGSCCPVEDGDDEIPTHDSTPKDGNITTMQIPPTLVERYKPAYELQDGSLERAGRASSASLKVNGVGVGMPYAGLR